MNSPFELLTHIIQNRRSIYPGSYTGEEVDDSKIQAILKNAHWAPTHKLTEPWHFIIFSGENRKKLSEYMGQYYLENTPPDKFSKFKWNKTRQKALKSSHIAAICMKRDPEERIPAWEELASLSCAVQNMWLSCTALGLGCYWSSSKSALDATQFLSLDKNIRCYGWFFIGIPVEGVKIEGKRSPVTNNIEWL